MHTPVVAVAGAGGEPIAVEVDTLLVVTQVTLATTLLLLAGLLVRSLRGLEDRELGFETEHQLMAALVGIQPPGDSAPERREAWRGLYEAGRQRLAALPGVEAATLTTAVPGTGKEYGAYVVLPERPDESFRIDLYQIGPDFFETFGISLVRGRSFDLGDRAGVTGAAIVNQAFVDRFFADVEPIGQEVRWPDLETDAADGRSGSWEWLPTSATRPVAGSPRRSSICRSRNTSGTVFVPGCTRWPGRPVRLRRPCRRRAGLSPPPIPAWP